MVDYANIPRDSRRVPIATKVQFKFDRFSGFISEYSSNLSPTGMFIVTEKPEPPGRILDLEFRLGDGFEIINGQGEVVWARTVPDGPTRPPGMGIRFLDLSPGSQELIYRIVDQYVAQGGIPFDLTGVYPAPVPALPAEPLPPLSREPDPFPDLEPEPVRDPSGTVLPWSPFQKETAMSGGDVLPPLEPLDEIFRLEEAPAGPAPAPPRAAAAAKAASSPQPVLPFPAPPAPALDPIPSLDPIDSYPELHPEDLDLTQAGPTVVGFDEPIPDSPAASSSGVALFPPPVENDPFAAYLPQPAALPEAPPVRPLSTLAGGASVQQPRRVFPWVLMAALLAVAAAGFLLRDQISGWIGLGGGEDEELVASQPVQPLPRPAAPPPAPTLQEEVSLTSDAEEPTVAAPSAPAAADPEPAQPLPEVVQRKPAPAPSPVPAPAGPAVSAVERITFEQAPGGTTIVLWGNGAMMPESYRQVGIDDPPRTVVQIRGVRRPFAPTRIPVGTSEVKQIRVGYHEKPGGNELHIVIDLAGSGVRVSRIEPDGQRLRIHLQRR